MSIIRTVIIVARVPAFLFIIVSCGWSRAWSRASCLRIISDVVYWYNCLRSKFNVVDSPNALRYFVLGQFASSKRIFQQYYVYRAYVNNPQISNILCNISWVYIGKPIFKTIFQTIKGPSLKTDL